MESPFPAFRHRSSDMSSFLLSINLLIYVWRRSSSSLRKQPENQYESINSVEAAKLLGTPDTNNGPASTKQEPPKVECEYAMVNKANKKVRNTP